MKLYRPLFLALLLATAALPVKADTAEQLAVRMSRMEDQMRQLMGQVEELTHEVQLLRNGATEKKSGALVSPDAAPVEAAQAGGQDSLQIEDTQQTSVDETQVASARKAAPKPQVLGASEPAAQPGDGGFEGQVLVAPGGETVQDANGIATVALADETPESLYERSNESLLRRRFDDAEAGFNKFLQTYPDHSLAGSARYWLGEAFYSQGDYRKAAQNFLQGYQKYPKSRRAPDSLLKLGLSLDRLGQKQQACAALGAVGSEFPKAVEAKKRAQTEFDRAGC
jgi:tol-pal system protein YbgF